MVVCFAAVMGGCGRVCGHHGDHDLGFVPSSGDFDVGLLNDY